MGRDAISTDLGQLRERLLGSRLGGIARRAWLRAKNAGLSRYCVVCGSHVRQFLAHGVERRPNAVCPVCQARDRHRLAWLWLTRETPLQRARLSFLHVAPEAGLARQLASLPNIDYVSGDLVHRAMLRMDVGKLPFGESGFDMIYCSHVLNMLPADGPAMSELHRVLKPQGMALIQVPAPVSGNGLEASTSSTRDERFAMHGDPDMYRRYGKQCLLDRLGSTGFEVESVSYFSEFSTAEQERLGLLDEDLVVCHKRP